MANPRRKPATDSEVFHYLYLRFDIVKASKILADAEVVTIKPDARWSVMVNVERDYALGEGVDVAKPVFIARMVLAGEVMSILIDGHHRNFKAFALGVETLNAKVLTVEQSFEILTVPFGLEKKMKEFKRDARKMGYKV